jgi:membrane-associated phospholipid phosphatase
VLAPVLTAAVVTVLIRRRVVDAVWLAAAYLGGFGLYSVAKPLVQRPRPPAADLLTAASGWAFPSGHATQAMVGLGALAVLLAGRSPRLRPWLLTAATVLVLLVGGSRVCLGAHWPTDVLAGWALGAAWLALVQAARLSLTGTLSGPRYGRGRTGPAAGTRTARGGRSRPGSA